VQRVGTPSPTTRHTLQNPDRQERRDPLLGLHNESNRPAAGRRHKLDREIACGTAPTGEALGICSTLATLYAPVRAATPKPFDHGLGDVGPHIFHYKGHFHYIVKDIISSPESRPASILRIHAVQDRPN